MYQTTTNTTSLSDQIRYYQPTAHITKSRGRLKTYGSNVYLKNGSTFEIELHNPKPNSIKAQIWINDQLISGSGLVIRPGQRVYLERFIDEAKKFQFNTYEVENTAQAKAAIASNGKVRVIFYDEVVKQQPITIPNDIFYPTYNSGSFGNRDFNLGMGTGYFPPTVNCFYSASVGNTSNMNMTSTMDSFSNSKSADSIETGRVEKGEKSKQTFGTSYESFNSWSCSDITWQILPESAKPVEAGEIRNYCPNCGGRQKKATWKFCPNCGTPINE